MKPGEYEILDADIELNKGRKSAQLKLRTRVTGRFRWDHTTIFETNPALKFDRDLARGYRLNIPAGTAIRFQCWIGLKYWCDPT